MPATLPDALVFYRLLLSDYGLEEWVTALPKVSDEFSEIMSAGNVEMAVLKFRQFFSEAQAFLPATYNDIAGGYMTPESVTPVFVTGAVFGNFLTQCPNILEPHRASALQLKDFFPRTKANGLRLTTRIDLLQGWSNFALFLFLILPKPVNLTSKPPLLQFMFDIIDIFKTRRITDWMAEASPTKPWLAYAINERVESVIRKYAVFAGSSENLRKCRSKEKIWFTVWHPVREDIRFVKREFRFLDIHQNVPAFYALEPMHYRVHFPCDPTPLSSSSDESTDTENTEAQQNDNDNDSDA